jgi:transcriptional regulator with XRE-family HTH domain
MEIKLSKYIKNYRLNKGLTGRQFAEQLGITYCTYLKIEKGETTLRISTINKVAKGMNLSIHKIRELISDD